MSHRAQSRAARAVMRMGPPRQRQAWYMRFQWASTPLGSWPTRVRVSSWTAASTASTVPWMEASPQPWRPSSVSRRTNIQFRQWTQYLWMVTPVIFTVVRLLPLGQIFDGGERWDDR